MMPEFDLEWDSKKEAANIAKHGVSFEEAQRAFLDGRRVTWKDVEHSTNEVRYYCFGKVGPGIMTVRYTMRDTKIRIIGAGYWRRGRKIYEKANQIHE